MRHKGQPRHQTVTTTKPLCLSSVQSDVRDAMGPVWHVEDVSIDRFAPIAHHFAEFSEKMNQMTKSVEALVDAVEEMVQRAEDRT